jgi:hypothetical protein
MSNRIFDKKCEEIDNLLSSIRLAFEEISGTSDHAVARELFQNVRLFSVSCFDESNLFFQIEIDLAKSQICFDDANIELANCTVHAQTNSCSLIQTYQEAFQICRDRLELLKTQDRRLQLLL